MDTCGDCKHMKRSEITGTNLCNIGYGMVRKTGPACGGFEKLSDDGDKWYREIL